jgi:CubicO group peptidase (beta-lactamase class C family)
MAVVIVQPGQTLLLEAFGKKSAGRDGTITSSTRFALGPASEAINSLLLARLDEQKLLALDAPARRCWDEFKLADATALKTVTLRELLAMTAGLPGRMDRFLAPATSSPADVFTVAAQIPVTAQPGENFEYCDASSAVAGYLAVYSLNHHRAPEAGLPAGYAELARTEILDPLGMKRATFVASKPTDADEASGHVRDGKGPWQPAPAATPCSPALLPACGLRLSAMDAAAWLQGELAGGLTADGKRLVAESAVQQRWRPESALDNRDFGLGWASQHYRGMEIVARIGEQDNQASLVAIVPQFRTAIAVLTNAGGHDAALFLQDALLNLADLLRESAPVK